MYIAGKIKKTIGNIISTGALCALLLGPLAALDPHLVGLDAQHLRHAHAELVGLDDAGDERGQLGHAGRGSTSRAAPRAATCRPASPTACAGTPRSARWSTYRPRAATPSRSARPGFHAHRHQVNRVGQLLEDRFLPRLDLAAQPVARGHIAQQPADRHQTPAGAGSHASAQRGPAPASARPGPTPAMVRIPMKSATCILFGLPASARFLRVRSIEVAGVIRPSIRTSPPTIGLTTRSENGCSSSISSKRGPVGKARQPLLNRCALPAGHRQIDER